MFDTVMEIAAMIVVGSISLLFVAVLVYAWIELVKHISEVF